MEASSELTVLYANLETFLLKMGGDVFKKELLFHFAFKRITNSTCVEVKPQIGVLPMHLKIDPKSIEFEEGFSRDVSTVGHFGTGDLELTLGGHADLKKAKGLICQSYELF